METSIAAEVARIIRHGGVEKVKKGPAGELHKPSFQSVDSVELSHSSTSEKGQWDRAHRLHVEHVKAQVENGAYRMDDSMRESIAGKIADMILA